MKAISGLIIILLAVLISCSSNSDQDKLTRNYNYYFGLIKRPDVLPEISDEERAAIQEQHLANISRLADSGVMALAGPFWDPDGEIRNLAGIFLYKVDSLNQAIGLAENDPAVKAGRLYVDVIPFLAPDSISYDPDSMTTYVAALYYQDTAWDESSFSLHLMERHQKKEFADLGDGSTMIFSGEFSLENNDDGLVGFIVYKADSITAIDNIVAKEPYVQQGYLKATVINWYGPLGLRFY